MIKAAIVDDETDAIKVLSTFVSRNFPQIELVSTFEQPDEAISMLSEDPPQILFLDIEMPGANGFEVLKAIGMPGMHCIFVTAYQEHAIQAIKMSAADYLLKPVDEEELIEAVQKVLDKIRKKDEINHAELLSSLKLKSPRIHISTGKGIQFIHCEEILFIKADGNYSNIYLQDGKKLTTIKKIHEFEELLSIYHSFSRVHKSYLVNLEKIHEYMKEGFIYLSDGCEIPVSRKYRDEFRKKLGF